MTKNVTHMPFCSQVHFLLYSDWNMETLGEDLDMTSVDANTLVERLSHFYIAARPKTTQKIMARTNYITQVLSSTSDLLLTDFSRITKE